MIALTRALRRASGDEKKRGVARVTFRRAATLAVLVLLTSILLSACGDDDDSGSSDAPAAESSAIEEAIERGKASAQRPTEIPAKEPNEADIPQDVTVYFLECSIEACTLLGDVMQEATDALGWRLRRVDAGITPETVKGAWELAARDKPDAVMASGFPHAVYQPELDALAKANIPIINMVLAEGSTQPSEYNLMGKQDFIRNGEINADWVLAELGDEAKVLYVNTSEFSSVKARADGFKARFEETCPKCSLELVEAQAADIGTNALPTQIVGRLQQDPDINLVVLGVGDMLTGLNSSLRAAGLEEKVKVLVSDMSPDILQAVRNGQVEASVMMEATDATMWQGADMILRHLTDQSVTSHEEPQDTWVVTAENSDGWEEPYPLVEDYQEQYKSLWGVDG
jgi:ribose transport system substrate-binding protein